MKVLMIDNYDSFTFNLYQYLCELGAKVFVFRNDEITLSEVQKEKYSHIVISPGPGNPNSAGLILDIIRQFSGEIPILGVCLGHQAIGQAFGGQVVRAPQLMHGKQSEITHDKKGVFKGVPQKFLATRYHSLVIKKTKFPKSLVVTAKTRDGTIMGLRHRKFKVEGVQFHPESYLTGHGQTILKNFLKFKEPKR